MPSKYLPNTYLLAGFDDLGTKLATEVMPSFSEADAEGRQRVKEGKCESYAILRVLFNSKRPQLYNYDVDRLKG